MGALDQRRVGLAELGGEEAFLDGDLAQERQRDQCEGDEAALVAGSEEP